MTDRTDHLKPLTGRIQSQTIGFNPLGENVVSKQHDKPKTTEPGKQQWMTSYVAAGFGIFPVTKDKIPVHKGWQHTKPDVTFDPADFPNGYGVNLRETDFVLDYDPRRDEAGDQLKRLWHQVGAGRQETFIVTSGGGGSHIYFTKPGDVRVKSTVPGFPAIEIKTKGRYVIGPGSPHPSGNVYKRERHNPKTILPVPDKLLLMCLASESSKPLTMQDDIEVDDEMTILRFTKWLQLPQTRARNAYQVACEGKNYGLPQSRVVELMLAHYDPFIANPNGEEQTADKVAHAWKYSQGKQGSKHPAADFGLPDSISAAGGEPTRHIKWDRTKAGDPLPTLNNVMNCLWLDTWGDELLDLFRHNDFTQQIEFSRPAPWGNQTPYWTDNDAVLMKQWMDSNRRPVTAAVGIMHEAVVVASHEHRYHPLRDWFESLVWDGKPRIDRWLTYYCQVIDSPYVREVGKNTLIGATARALDPGCKHDYMLILEGEKGIRKTTAVEILGGEYAASLRIDPHDKDTVQAMTEKWIIECAEMEFLKRAEVSALKAFLTKRVDRIRLPYGRTTLDLPRKTIFIGTVNPTSEGYLREWDRRYWPVYCNGVIDTDGLERDRDQLFAEAYVRYMKGEPHYITDPAIDAMARQIQEQRVEVDAWEETIAQWMVKWAPHGATINQIADHCLCISKHKLNMYDRKRMAEVLRKLGYSDSVRRQDGVSVKWWSKDADAGI